MATFITSPAAPSPIRQRRARTIWRYSLAVGYEFRVTLCMLGAAMAIGTFLYAITQRPDLSGRPSFLTSLYGAWMSMLAQPLYSPPPTWYLTVMCMLYPVLGFILIGEGVVRLALLMISRRQGEKEWMRVMASTYSNHVVLCGIGHLGYRVLEQLVASHVPVVAIEKNEGGRFLTAAKALGVPVLVRDMKEDQSLIEAGIETARAVIIATNDDMANLEVALDSRRMNPKIRVVMRLFDQQIAGKIAGAMMVDAAFSASALAAPIVAALSMQDNLFVSTVIAGIPHASGELTVAPHSVLAGQRFDKLEGHYGVRILARIRPNGTVDSPPDPAGSVGVGDRLATHAQPAQLAGLAAAASIATP